MLSSCATATLLAVTVRSRANSRLRPPDKSRLLWGSGQKPGPLSVYRVTNRPLVMTTSKTSKPAHAMYGAPVSNVRPASAQAGSRIAAASGPYLGRQRCIANNDTCEGPQAKGSEYCIGHLRSAEKGRDVS